jgi:hypothetical protein
MRSFPPGSEISGTASLAGTDRCFGAVLVPFSQQNASAQYPEPNESSLRCNIHPPIYTEVLQVVLISLFYNPNTSLILYLSRAQ